MWCHPIADTRTPLKSAGRTVTGGLLHAAMGAWWGFYKGSRLVYKVLMLFMVYMRERSNLRSLLAAPPALERGRDKNGRRGT